MSELNLDALRECVGKTSVREDEIRSDALMQFRGMLEDYLVPADVEAVPPGFHWTLYQPRVGASELREDGHPVQADLLPELPFAARMWAGGEVIFHGSLDAGDRVVRQSTVKSFDLKSGSTGPLLFINIGHEYRVNDALVISETQTLVYRDPSRPKVSEPSEDAKQVGVSFCADSRLLFRYSALTFNTHRIHYDREYATKVEGYPDLVVHGPLQATLLMNRVAGALGHSRFQFSYRGAAPLFAGQAAYICKDEGSEGAAWVERAPGDATMKAHYRSIEL